MTRIEEIWLLTTTAFLATEIGTRNDQPILFAMGYIMAEHLDETHVLKSVRDMQDQADLAIEQLEKELNND